MASARIVTAAVFATLCWAVSASAQAQDALTTKTLTEVCFPEIIDQKTHEPDLLMVSSAAYSLDYNQNLEADLSQSDVLYKRVGEEAYHLEIGEDEQVGFYCGMTLPPFVTQDQADAAVGALLNDREGWNRFPRFGDAAPAMRWSRTDRLDDDEIQRSVAVETLEGDGRVRVLSAWVRLLGQ